MMENKTEMLRYLKLDDKALAPRKGSQHSAGFDFAANESLTIPAGKSAVIGTGLAVDIDVGYYGYFEPRSKLASRMGLVVYREMAKVVDCDYRNEVMLSVMNLSDKDLEIRKGDYLLQMIIREYKYDNGCIEVGYFTEVREVSETDRGKAGIKSTEMRVK